MPDNIKMRIIAKIKEFVREQGKDPTEIRLTRIEECELRALTPDDVGELAAKISAKGPRKAIIEDADGTIFGVKVEWDARVFDVA